MARSVTYYRLIGVTYYRALPKGIPQPDTGQSDDAAPQSRANLIGVSPMNSDRRQSHEKYEFRAIAVQTLRRASDK
jgi:hypothetical protein